MRADLDTLLIAVYCAACSLFPAASEPRRGRPQLVTDNELLSLMVAQMLLGQPSDRRFLSVAKRRLGHLLPQLPSQSRYNERCRQLAPKLVTLWRAIAYELPGFHDSLSLVDTAPLPCAQSIATVNRSQLAPWRGFGYSAAHSRFYWGMRLVLWCGPDGCVRDFDLVPANAGEREAVLELLGRHPPAGELVIADKGFAGADFEQAVAELGGLLLRPSRANEPERSSPRSGASASASSRSSTRSRTALLGAPSRANPGRTGLPHRRAHPRPHRGHPPQLAARLATASPDCLRALIDQPSRLSA